MKIAIYRSVSLDFDRVIEVEDYYEESADHIRLTEPVEVDFVYLPSEVTVPPQLAALDEVRNEELARHLTALQAIDEKKAKLLAIESDQ
jgi:hypothetical protein